MSGKWVPRSPSPLRPSTASASACATTSASLWPARPRAPVDRRRRRARAGGRDRTRRGGRRSPGRPARQRPASVLGPDQVGRRRQLQVVGVARHDRTVRPERLDQRRVVGRVGLALMGAAGAPRRRTPGASARRPGRPGRGSRRRPARRPRGRGGHPFHGVVTATRADRAGRPARSSGRDDRREELRAGQGPGRVVHHHDLGVRAQGLEPGPHRGRHASGRRRPPRSAPCWLATSTESRAGTTSTTGSATDRHAVTAHRATVGRPGRRTAWPRRSGCRTRRPRRPPRRGPSGG